MTLESFLLCDSIILAWKRLFGPAECTFRSFGGKRSHRAILQRLASFDAEQGEDGIDALLNMFNALLHHLLCSSLFSRSPVENDKSMYMSQHSFLSPSLNLQTGSFFTTHEQHVGMLLFELRERLKADVNAIKVSFDADHRF